MFNGFAKTAPKVVDLAKQADRDLILEWLDSKELFEASKINNNLDSKYFKNTIEAFKANLIRQNFIASQLILSKMSVALDVKSWEIGISHYPGAHPIKYSLAKYKKSRGME
ncbi:hypothetical protein ACWATR_38315 [Nostoc sp. UIC 10890]